MFSAVFVAVRVDDGQDVDRELVQQVVVLALRLHHPVNEVGHGCRADPLTGVDATVDEDGRFVGSSRPNLNQFERPTFRGATNISDRHLVAEVLLHAVQPGEDGVDTLVLLPVHPSLGTGRLAQA